MQAGPVEAVTLAQALDHDPHALLQGQELDALGTAQHEEAGVLTLRGSETSFLLQSGVLYAECVL